MTFVKNYTCINITTLSYASTGLEFFNSVELKTCLPRESKIYPFSLEGYISILDIEDYEVKSYTVVSQKAKERVAKLSGEELVKRLNNPDFLIEPNDKILFNVQSGELIGSAKTNRLFSKIFRGNPITFKDADNDESLVWVAGKFMRTTKAFANMLALKIRIDKEIFEAFEISDLLLGLFLELEEIKLSDFTRIDEIIDTSKPGKMNFDLYQNAYGKLIDSFVK